MLVEPATEVSELAGVPLSLLRCPACAAALTALPDRLVCANPAAHTFPVVDGVPVLIDEGRSLFSLADYTGRAPAAGSSWLRRSVLLPAIGPSLNANVKAAANYRRFAALLAGRTARARVLVVGGGIAGAGMRALAANPALDLIATDVFFGDGTALICDAHDLPFADGAFDAVIIQAVLEHVVDPYRCVGEIHRVLGERGLVYAETPFMQQVHLGRYDFTRFTHLGHRRLFRHFAEIDSGAGCGPGMALAWSCEYFLLSFVRGRAARALVRAFSRAAFFWLKYFDRRLIDRPGALDAASGYYFLGEKSARVLSDRELVTLYRGAIG